MLFRVFPWIPEAGPAEPGGALHVPRGDQGGGRHDNPDRYGAVYLSRSRLSPIAETLRALRRHQGPRFDLVVEAARLALVSFEENGLDGALLDLDDPANLLARGLRPSRIATHDRELTRATALALFEEDHPGFEWWSTIESSWINVTLFAERSLERLRVLGDPEPLTLDHPAVRDAADAVGVVLAA